MSAKDAFNAADDLNPTGNTHIQDLISARLSRRQTLKGGIGLTASLMFAGTSLTACGGGDDEVVDTSLKLGFTAVGMNKLDVVSVPSGYQVAILHALGDPMHYGDASWADNGSESADSYNRRIGCGHDGMHYFGLSDAGKFDSARSDRGLVCVNHEYVVSPYGLHPSGVTAGATRVASEVDKEINAHGVSVVEVKRGTSGTAMTMVRGSRYNRRVTSATEMDFGGPVKGNALVKTKFSTDCNKTRGTNNNCGNGYTPWGTYLTCEENFTNVISRVSPDATSDDDVSRRAAKEVTGLKRYGMTNARNSPYLWNTAGSDDLYVRWNCAVTGASATDDYRNVFNTFGYVVEIDPFQPDSTPVKRTALGRFAHEGAWPAPAVKGQPIVIYTGDDSRNEYIYKYVSTALWDDADINGGLAAGAKYLDDGKLYVAKFNADGTGEWIELSITNTAIASYATYTFADQADVLVHARLAADAVGATKMDRPEWGAVNPLNNEVYMTLTNNAYTTASGASSGNRVAANPDSAKRQATPDAANPRFYVEETSSGNVNGHIIRWKEAASQAATAFTWDIYLFGAENDAAANVNLSGLTDVNFFSSPDGLVFGPQGLLWIQTDDGAFTDVTNCMMLAAVPGKVGDGAKATAAGGTETYVGAQATSDNVRRFLVGPKDCEITGFAATPDGKTVFINVQHPGENGNLGAATSASPDSQTNSTSTKRPRSATVVVTRTDGGVVGL